MAIHITMSNSGGQIDYRKAETPVDAAQALSEMVLAAGELFGGDKIIIEEDELEGGE